MNMQSSLGRAFWLVFARGVVRHWWLQRMTAIANLPLGLWLILSILSGHAEDHDAVRAWLSNWFHGAMMILLTVNAAYHFTLGLQVVIEDYVHNRTAEAALLILIRFGTVFLVGGAVISVLRILLAGA